MDWDHYGYPATWQDGCEPEPIPWPYPKHCEWTLLRNCHMDIREAFPSKYVKASDIKGEQKLTIEQAVMESVDPAKDPQPVLYFNEARKGLVLNVTNGHALEEMYGYETDRWKGKPVTLFAVQTEFQGRPVMGIRIKLEQQPPPDQDIPEDEIPF